MLEFALPQVTHTYAQPRDKSNTFMIIIMTLLKQYLGKV